MKPNDSIRRIAAQIAPKLTAIRRDFHAHPEIGHAENRTTRKIAEILKAAGVNNIHAPVDGTGVVGLLSGAAGGTGKTIALRADIDALPVLEENNIPYKSLNPGVMHACGHDAHITMCLGAAMILKRLQGEIKGRVKFIFQPAEELLDGAQRMIRAGVMERPKVDAIFALHVMPDVAFGTVSSSPGPGWAAADRFVIEIKGRGGHGAWPSRCVDPILAAHEIYSGLQSIQRNLLGTDAWLISVCSIHAGTAFNIIPDKAVMEGTVRTFDKQVQATIIRRMRAIVKGVASAYGAKGKLIYEIAVPATINDKKADLLLRNAARELGIPAIPAIPSMGGEDFSFFQRLAPGAIARIGTRTRKGIPGLHSSRFDLDERILPIGASLLARCALSAMETR